MEFTYIRKLIWIFEYEIYGSRQSNNERVTSSQEVLLSKHQCRFQWESIVEMACEHYYFLYQQFFSFSVWFLFSLSTVDECFQLLYNSKNSLITSTIVIFKYFSILSLQVRSKIEVIHNSLHSVYSLLFPFSPIIVNMDIWGTSSRFVFVIERYLCERKIYLNYRNLQTRL